MMSSSLKQMIPQMVASGQFKKVDTPDQVSGGGMSPRIQPQTIKVGPMQRSGVAVPTPGELRLLYKGVVLTPV